MARYDGLVAAPAGAPSPATEVVPDREVTLETPLHRLALRRATAGGSTARVNPPVRTEADREALWRGVQDGRIDTVVSGLVPGPWRSGTARCAGHPGEYVKRPAAPTRRWRFETRGG